MPAMPEAFLASWRRQHFVGVGFVLLWPVKHETVPAPVQIKRPALKYR